MLELGLGAVSSGRTIMKVWHFLMICWILTACDSAAPPNVPPSTEPLDAGLEPSDASAEDEIASAPDENPLRLLLEQDLPYGEGENGNLVGFLAMPDDAAEPLPGVLLLHEWWGLNEAIKSAARRLAREGYIVLAVDLYGGRVASSDAEAQALMAEIVGAADRTRDNLRQAYEYLERYAFSPTIASVGWDMGGRWALQTALMLPEQLDAMVMYYGGVVTDEAALDTLRMPMLGLFGGEDRSIPLREVQEFRSTLRRLGKRAEVRIYPGAGHGFFFPDSPNYNPIAADDAWIRTLTHLEASLKN
jgi:carboxymethylenebutenolidase